MRTWSQREERYSDVLVCEASIARSMCLVNRPVACAPPITMPRWSLKKTEQMRERVNFYYWQTSCSVARIARHLSISEATVNKLIGPRPDGIVTPRRGTSPPY